MVSVWFKHETNLIVMMDVLKLVKEELDKAACKIHRQNAKARLEVSPQRRLGKSSSHVSQRTQGGGT